MSSRLTIVLLTLALVAGCSDDSDGTGGAGGTGGAAGTGGSGGARACATDIAVGEVQNFGEATPSRSEGLTFGSAGDLFVSVINDPGDDQLLQFMPDGSFVIAAEAESILGLASYENDILAAGIATGDLLQIDPATGMTPVLASGLDAPNFVVTTPWGTTLVSDDTAGTSTIVEVTFDGDVSVWSDGVPTPNGMVFSLDGRTLYVAATFDEEGLWRVPVSENGEAGTPDRWVEFDDNSAPDGVAIDSLGNVYVALNLMGEIAQVAPDGSVTMLTDGIGGVASLAFGQGTYDPCSIYASNLFDTQLWRIGVGILGPDGE